ncbi:MAG: hypothetical protein ACRDJN_12795 [Chloroflexota bacterium]
MEWSYVAQQPMKVGERVYQPGELLPDEFASRPGVEAEVAAGRCLRVPQPPLGSAPTRPAAREAAAAAATSAQPQPQAEAEQEEARPRRRATAERESRPQAAAGTG